MAHSSLVVGNAAAVAAPVAVDTLPFPFLFKTERNKGNGEGGIEEEAARERKE